jgi:transposase
VRSARVWKRLLGVEHTVIERVLFDEDADALVVLVRPTRSRRGRCGRCQRRCPGDDQGDGRRRWRTLDLGTVQALPEADAPRVRCRQHGVVAAAVSWARHGAGFTRTFEDTAAWLATHTSRVAVAELLRVAWRSVGRVCARVAAEQTTKVDLLAGLRRIGIDEVSYKKGQRYLTVVVDTTKAGWCGPRQAPARPPWNGSSTSSARPAAPRSSWSARTPPTGSPPWWHAAARPRSAAPTRSTWPEWATDALDQVRREVCNSARKGGDTAVARELKGARFALWNNPEDLTRRQRGKLARIAQANQRLYRAYLLKEELRLVFKVKGPRAVALLDAWLAWARRCRIPAFVALARSVTAYRDTIVASLPHGASNARVESVNTRLRLLTRIAFGFRSTDALVGLAMLALGGLCPPLPGR